MKQAAHTRRTKRSVVFNQREIKQFALRVFFLLECIIFFYLFFCGTNGVLSWRSWRIRNAHIANKIEELKQDIAHAEQEINEWKLYPFYQEKIAREQLQMAHTDDIVYYLP